MPNIIEILKSYLNQTKIPDKILICIPEFSKRFLKPYIISDELLDFVKQNEIISIIRCEDYGPGTKLLGAIKHVPKDCNILVCDDDRKLSSNFVKLFYDKSQLNKDKIITGKYRSQGLVNLKLMGKDLFQKYN